LYRLWKTSPSQSITSVLQTSFWRLSSIDQTAQYTQDWIKFQSSRLASPYFSYALKYFNITEFDPFSSKSGINIWDLFPPEVSCPDIERVGNIGEGGKWVCGLSWLKKQASASTAPLRGSSSESKCIIYSYGVSIETTFEQHMLSLPDLRCEIFAFDPTVVKVNNIPSNASLTFHKQALWSTSGSTDQFIFTEHLFDTMNRLNHSFIDILKIDIEGSEWEIFHDLFQRARHIRSAASKTTAGGPTWTLPFGQLLIELHYENTSSTVEFFSGMAEFGFLPFSREINLQPCLDGRLPFAVEYSLIHSSFFDETKRHHLSHALPPVVTPSWAQKPNAVIYYLTQKRRLVMMGSALQSLYNAFYRQFPFYNVLIFHDDLTAADRREMQAYVPLMKLHFIEIEFDIPKHLRPPNRPAPPPRVAHCSPNSSTIGYRHMIMFHSTWIHRYLFNPAHGYSDVEFILRLDDDSSFSSPIGYDIFKMMEKNNLSYGFVTSVQDDPDCVRGLWNFTWDFLRNASNSLSKYRISEANLDYFRDHWPEGSVIYNNFELSSAKIWKTPLWNDFMSAVNENGGVYRDRWGDAPLHTIYLLLAIPLSEVHAFSDLPYRHDPFVNRIGTGLPPPSAFPFEDGSIVCVYYAGWKCQGKNSSNVTQVSYLSGGPLTPSWGSKRIVQRVGWNDIAPPIFPTHSKRLVPLSLERETIAQSDGTKKRKIRGVGLVIAPPYSQTNSSPISFHERPSPSGVLYTFGHLKKFQLLAEMVNNFYANYVKAHPCPIVVFHFPNFNASLIDHLRQHLLVEGVRNLTHFVVVEASYLCHHSRNASNDCESYSTSSLPSAQRCIPSDLEVFGASRFLVKDAVVTLHRMGYDWTFRVSDRSLLAEPIKYNLFHYLESHGLRYGFNNVVKENPNCIPHLWKKVNQLCALPRANCTSLWSEWTEGLIVYTNFEISHKSVWKAPIFLSLLSLSLSDENYEDSLYWSDAPLHTIAVATSLTSKQIHKFEDIRYSLVALVPSPESTSSSQQLKVLPSVPMSHYNAQFQPQRFGWLGGDIGASFVLPPLRCAQLLLHAHESVSKSGATNPSLCSQDAIASKSIWLFGDSLIGTSTPARYCPPSVTPVPLISSLLSLVVSKLSSSPTLWGLLTSHWMGTSPPLLCQSKQSSE
jgi:hypothetical protein